MSTAISNKDLKRFKFWLIVTQFCLALLIMDQFVELIDRFKNIYLDDKWLMLVTPGSYDYNPAYAALMIFEDAFSVLFILMSILMTVLLHRKSRRFPELFSVMLWTIPIYMIVCLLAGGLIISFDSTFTWDRIISLAAASIGVFLVSEFLKKSKLVEVYFSN